MKIIDTHAHYDDSAFDGDRYELLDRILNESVDKIINIGCSLESSKKSIAFSEKYDNIFAAVGIHPDDADNVVGTDYINQLSKLAQNKKVVAIGEIGLDYHYDGFSRDNQIEVFRSQIELAKKISLPIIIHSRDATEDTLEILKETKPDKAVMHCYSGSAETARILLSMGLYISFTGVLTFKNAKKAISAAEIIPNDRIMLETDSPYMAPTPFRGERCNSSMTHMTAGKLAEIKHMDIEETIKMCNENAERFFNFKSHK